MNKTTLIAFGIIMLAAGAAYGHDGDCSDGDKKGRRGPPQQAIQVCTELSEGDGCEFIGRRDDSVSGNCLSGRDQLVCVPEHRQDRFNARHSE